MCPRSLASTGAELRHSNLSPSKMGKQENISHEKPETLHSETKNKKDHVEKQMIKLVNFALGKTFEMQTY